MFARLCEVERAPSEANDARQDLDGWSWPRRIAAPPALCAGTELGQWRLIEAGAHAAFDAVDAVDALDGPVAALRRANDDSAGLDLDRRKQRRAWFSVVDSPVFDVPPSHAAWAARTRRG